MRRFFVCVLLLTLAGCGSGPQLNAPSPAASSATTVASPLVTAAPTMSPTASPLPTLSATMLTLEPAEGPPGTLVTVAGFAPGGAVVRTDKGDDGATVCWAGCDGLMIDGAPLHWSDTEPGRFTLQFTVPSIPWLGGDGPHPLIPGSYTVGVVCVPMSNGCATREPQATATFTLRPPTPATCRADSCASLQLTPASGPPGSVVKIHGWAPLARMNGPQPSSYSLLVQRADGTQDWNSTLIEQTPNGDLSGSFQLPLALPNLGPLTPGAYTIALVATHRASTKPPSSSSVTIRPMPQDSSTVNIILAPTTFTITAAPTWASLGSVRPLWIAQNPGQPLAVDLANPRRIAYCAPGTIRSSSDGGASWSSVSTTGIAAAAKQHGLSLFAPDVAPSPPQCTSVVLDSQHPRSFYVTIGAVRPEQGIPPSYSVGAVTTDNGQTWQIVAPDGATPEHFGGFQADDRGVYLFFNDPVIVQLTTDGGRTWTTGHPACPLAGPCVRWGAVDLTIGGMSSPNPLLIEYSSDGGQTWLTPPDPRSINLRVSTSATLAALSPTSVVLLAGREAFPALLSNDGGATWTIIALPPLVGSDTSYPLYARLELLPNGSLIAQASENSAQWQMLQPGAQAWCRLVGAALPALAAPQPIGDQVWWYSPSEAPTPQHVPLTQLPCG